MKRFRTPQVIQMESVECGAACIAILLGYYGRYEPLEVLRVECGVSRDGSNAANMVKAAQKYGLEGSGYKKSTEELKKLEAPAILLWEFNHFVVWEGFKGNTIYLNDPASGFRTISLDEFNESYSGIVLEFSQKAGFEKKGYSAPFFRQVYDRLKVAKLSLIYLWLIGFCLLLPGLLMPAFLKVFLDSHFVIGNLPWKWLFLGAVLLTSCIAAGMTWMQGFILTRLNNKLSFSFSSDFLWHLLKLPLSFYSQRYGGEIAYRISLNDEVAEALTTSLLTAGINIILVLFYGFTMILYNPLIACIGIGFGVLNLIVMEGIYRLRANSFACLQQEFGKTIGEAIGGVQAIESIKAKAQESDFFSRWEGFYTRVANSQIEIGKKDILLTTVPLLFQMLALTALLGLGSLRIIEGTMTIGTLMAMQILQTNFLLPINRFVGLGELLQNTKINLGRLNDVLRNPIDPSYQKKQQIKPDKRQLAGKIEFRNVTFGFSPLSDPLIQTLSFTIESGKSLAIVGPTGSGKSTIAKLAAGLFQPWSGEILYDGIPLAQIPKELFVNSMATVDQEIFLFQGSIRENLTLWNSKLPEETLISACQDAEINEEIITRPGGYDALLIEGGRNLSGGQRQRLEIARALLYNPSVLILDEATSALDSMIEEKIMTHLSLRGCSLLMIAHRLSTVQDCDEILVLKEGKVIQRGTHQALASQEGLYRELCEKESFI